MEAYGLSESFVRELKAVLDWWRRRVDGSPRRARTPEVLRGNTWLELAANLDADGEADANPLEWDVAMNAYTVDTTTTVKVKDFGRSAHGLIGDRLRAVYRYTDGDTRYYEALSTGPQWRDATLGADLTAGGSATATVTVRGASVTVTVHDAFLAPGGSLSAGSSVGIEYSAEAKQWTVTEAECPAS